MGEGSGGEFVGFGEVEVFGEDADDLVGQVCDLNGAGGDLGIGIEEGLPEMPADDGDLLVALGGFFRQEVAAEDGLDAQDIEEVGKGADASNEMGVIVGKADSGGTLLEDAEVVEGSGSLAPEVEVAWIGSGIGEEFLEEADALPDDDEAAAVAVGEGLEEDAIDDAEEGGGGSNAEGQGKDGGEGEAGGLAELAQA